MPRIPDQLLNSVVYLFQDEEHARKGRGAGGTGFVVEYPGGGQSDWFVVSNVHVVHNGCTTLRINTNDGSVATVELEASKWVDHPDGDDVSAATAAQIALAWLLAQGDDIAPIPGTKRVPRVEENTAADGIELSAEQIERLNELAPATGERHDDANMAVIDR
jgi:hypothetical protein